MKTLETVINTWIEKVFYQLGDRLEGWNKRTFHFKVQRDMNGTVELVFNETHQYDRPLPNYIHGLFDTEHGTFFVHMFGTNMELNFDIDDDVDNIVTEIFDSIVEELG